MKASDEFVIPACPPCHYEYDYGKHYSREEKQGRWDMGHEEWARDRVAAMSDPWKRREVIGDATLYLGDCLEILPTLPKVTERVEK